jgi:hypothetical protein
MLKESSQCSDMIEQSRAEQSRAEQSRAKQSEETCKALGRPASQPARPLRAGMALIYHLVRMSGSGKVPLAFRACFHGGRPQSGSMETFAQGHTESGLLWRRPYVSICASICVAKGKNATHSGRQACHGAAASNQFFSVCACSASAEVRDGPEQPVV